VNRGPDWKPVFGFICYPRKTRRLFIYLNFKIQAREGAAFALKWLDLHRGSDDHVNCGPVSTRKGA
jgi:hypothetical protein